MSWVLILAGPFLLNFSKQDFFCVAVTVNNHVTFVAVLLPTHTKCSGLLCRSSGKDIVLVSGATNTSIASAATVAAAVHADDVVVFGINVAILFCCYCYREYDGVISGSCQIAYRIFSCAYRADHFGKNKIYSY